MLNDIAKYCKLGKVIIVRLQNTAFDYISTMIDIGSYWITNETNLTIFQCDDGDIFILRLYFHLPINDV